MTKQLNLYDRLSYSEAFEERKSLNTYALNFIKFSIFDFRVSIPVGNQVKLTFATAS